MCAVSSLTVVDVRNVVTLLVAVASSVASFCGRDYVRKLLLIGCNTSSEDD